MQIDILVLNYNGRHLLSRCLPSVVEAAAASMHRCRVGVIDNASADGSVDWLGEHFPQVKVFSQPNRGLCSFNLVVAQLDSPVVILLNNDVRLARDAVDSWVAPLVEGGGTEQTGCWMTAPRCYGREGQYEGTKTAVRWRWGLVQASAFLGDLPFRVEEASETASAGAALAVDRAVFCRLGGFDPLYLPGRLEDLDLAFRAFLAGYHARYVPEAVVWHEGMGTFGPVFGQKGCQHLALRNTLLFQWKNLRTWPNLLRHAGGLFLRLAADMVRAPFVKAEDRWEFWRAFWAALGRLTQLRPGRRSADGPIPGGAVRETSAPIPKGSLSGQAFRRQREREFFCRFAPERLAQAGLETAPISLRQTPSKTTPFPPDGDGKGPGRSWQGFPNTLSACHRNARDETGRTNQDHPEISKHLFHAANALSGS